MKHSPPLRPHQDAGLQPERTSLAWRRTLLSLVGASLLCLRWLPHHRVFALLLVGLTLAAALGIGAALTSRYRQGVSAINRGQAIPPVLEVMGLTLACVTLGVLGLYGVLGLAL
ncbi:DUF202 domain-containing protein [Pseudomonas massiliensis]|uniref:DUF202 domain-containing protein n=1 Tax=Pseudomonas massiliensis TaxID=522492 RepID=UPI000590BB1C|nr:DUF202 domain-containing protein [Pseudomonas massiliensis]